MLSTFQYEQKESFLASKFSVIIEYNSFKLADAVNRMIHCIVWVWKKYFVTL